MSAAAQVIDDAVAWDALLARVPPSVPALVSAAAARMPDAPAVSMRGDTLSYRQLLDAAARCAGGLIAGGVRPGDRVVVWMPKTVDTAVAMLAVWLAGGVLVPANPVLKAPQLRHILADSGAIGLITQPQRYDLLRADAVPTPALLVTSLDQVRSAAPAETVTRDRHDLAALLYTSGSTGPPKGVMVTHHNLCCGAVSVSTYLGLTAQDRTLCVLPLGFDYGLNQLLSSWLVGGCAVLSEYLLPADIPQQVAAENITTLAGVPPLWLPLAAIPWPEAARASLRRLTNSGGHLPRPTVGALRQLFPDADLHLMYGLTEAFRSTTLPPALVDQHPGSIGRAVPLAEVLVVDAQGRETAAGVPGELVHVGPFVAQGYWHDPERTAQRFRPAPSCSQRAQPGAMAVWSGDTVVRDADGLLHFVGRTDEMIKSSGYRISPTEVEEAVLATGLVREVVACGIPDPLRGQVVALAVVPMVAAADFTEQLLAACRQRLPGPWVPALIQALDALPRGSTGKYDRASLARQLRAPQEAGA